MADVMILARLAWLRLLRGRTKWVTALLAVLPPVFAALLSLGKNEPDEVWQISVFLALRYPVLIAIAVHLASAVGEELENRTYTYLWSRPMRRSALVFGKLVATVPAVAAVFALSIVVTWLVVWGAEPAAHLEELVRGLGATVAVVISGAALALVAGAWVPKWPLAILLLYVMVGERLLEFVPLLQKISIAFHASAISAAHPPKLQVGTTLEGGIGLLVLSLAWLVLTVWRVETTEYALPDA